jgi:hypothetical protein
VIYEGQGDSFVFRQFSQWRQESSIHLTDRAKKGMLADFTALEVSIKKR